MSKLTVVTQDCNNIKQRLQELIGKEVTITIKDRTKLSTKKGIITLVSDNLFCIDIKLGKYHTTNSSYTFLDIKTNKVKIKEAPFLNDEIPQTV